MITPSLNDWLCETISSHDFSIRELNGGANNKGFRIDSQENSWFLKCFSPSHQSSSYKQHNEFQFSQFLWQNNIKSIPKPFALSHENHASLYSFEEGERISVATSEKVKSALTFVRDINTLTSNPSFPNIASESPNCLFDFYSIVDNRLNRFKHIEYDESLMSLLSLIHERNEQLKKKMTDEFLVKLEKDVNSPSDFGFHNALETKAGKTIFFDFEYAGVDTSWKLICDFFSQPAVPVKINHLELFLSDSIFQHIAREPNKLKIVFELTQLKWCLIMLNEFLSEIQSRRQFSWNKKCINQSIEEIKSKQLAKSRHYFDSIAAKLELLSDIYDK